MRPLVCLRSFGIVFGYTRDSVRRRGYHGKPYRPSPYFAYPALLRILIKDHTALCRRLISLPFPKSPPNRFEPMSPSQMDGSDLPQPQPAGLSDLPQSTSMESARKRRRISLACAFCRARKSRVSKPPVSSKMLLHDR